MKPANLLRCYPRAWRDRYGEELLALIQDDLAEGRPTWRLRLGLIWGGLRERGHQAWHAVRVALNSPAGAYKWASILWAGLVCASVPGPLIASPPAARGWQPVALAALLAAIALTGAAVLAGGLAALPALVRFLRAGGWPAIRRRVGWSAGATVVAGAGLAGLALVSGPLSPDQLNVSLVYLAGLLVTGLATAVAIGLWATTVTATARRLTLEPRVRAAQLVLGAVLPTAVMIVASTLAIWWSTAQPSTASLVVGLVNLAVASVAAPVRIGQAVRRGRRLRLAASGATIINASAQRAHGRHRA